MSDTPSVTIGVPVYQGELFLEEVLRSIQSQTYQNIKVIISLDGSQPVVEQLCQPFLKDSRFRLVIQPKRLGWVGNINSLIGQVDTPYWYCHPQDDLVDPRYVEILLKHAEQTPQAAVVYCDIIAFGEKSNKIFQPSVTGNAFTRQITLLRKHHSAVAFRGLTRLEASRHVGAIPTNEFENFSADTIWMAAVARWGDLKRVPIKMYKKRYHANNEHSKWSAWPLRKRSKAWMTHCADMLQQAMLIESTVQERRLLWLATVQRLVSWRTASNYLPVTTWTSTERLLQVNEFLEYMQTTKRMDIPLLLEDNWDNINLWTRKFLKDEIPIIIFWEIWPKLWQKLWK